MQLTWVRQSYELPACWRNYIIKESSITADNSNVKGGSAKYFVRQSFFTVADALTVLSFFFFFPKYEQIRNMLSKVKAIAFAEKAHEDTRRSPRQNQGRRRLRGLLPTRRLGRLTLATEEKKPLAAPPICYCSKIRPR